MKKILLCTDGSAYSQVSYEYAAWLAQKIDFAIEVLYVTDSREEKAVRSNDFSGSIGIDAYQQLLKELVEVEASKAKINHKRAKILLEDAEKFFSDRKIDRVKLTYETGSFVDLFNQFESNSDLVILGKRGENASKAREHLGSNLERIVRSSHKPCLVTPKQFQPVNRVLLAYDGGKSCQKAVDYLAKLPAFGVELHIVYVVTKDESTAKQHLATASKIVEKAGFNPICEALHGDTESEIEKYIEQKNIDLLLMGAYGHSRIRQLIIGSTTTQMLLSSHIPVCLFR